MFEDIAPSGNHHSEKPGIRSRSAESLDTSACNPVGVLHHTVSGPGSRHSGRPDHEADHTNQPRFGGATYNNVLVNPQGVIIGEQKDFTQNNTAGIDPSAFVQLAGYVGQISGTLNMSDPDRVELERVAQELHAEATSPNPEPGRIRQIATQLKDKLLEASTTIAATMGVQMAEQALGTLT
ncbi:hypothetical protein [Streptomyces hirsutus]|uniref:hypothetical protein n=1 Tax=Streptomyces hirsutus TaxID=35620 RepID=UPI0036B68A84